MRMIFMQYATAAYLAIYFIALVAEAGAQDDDAKCDSMWKAYEYLCPGKIPRCLEPTTGALDVAVVLNWKLMVALAKAERRIKELEAAGDNNNVPTYEESTIPVTTAMRTTEIFTTGKPVTSASGGTCEGGFLGSDKCYTLLLTDGLQFSMNYTEAESHCNISGSLPAEIKSRWLQYNLEHFLRPKIPSGSNAFEIWTGMKYSYFISNILFRSGMYMSVYNLALDSRFTAYDQQSTQIAFYIPTSAKVNQGILNHRKDKNLQGVLCERDI